MARDGNSNRKMRAWAKAKLPAPCRRCGITIPADAPASTWHAGHIVDDALGGEVAANNVWPEHAKCNTSAGGRLAAELRRGEQTTVERMRPGFWFPPRRTS